MKILILGAGGSGKDFLKKKLIEKGFKGDISHTTRPKRSNESDGVDYHFVSEDEFIDMINKDLFLQNKSFREWRYGTTLEEWNTKDVFIVTPEGLYAIPEDLRKDCVVIYLDIPLEIRKQRLEARGDADSVDRRLAADLEQFKDFTGYTIRIANPDF